MNGDGTCVPPWPRGRRSSWPTTRARRRRAGRPDVVGSSRLCASHPVAQSRHARRPSARLLAARARQRGRIRRAPPVVSLSSASLSDVAASRREPRQQSLGAQPLGLPLVGARLVARRREVLGRGRTLGGNGVGQERRGGAFCLGPRRAGGVLALVGGSLPRALRQPASAPAAARRGRDRPAERQRLDGSSWGAIAPFIGRTGWDFRAIIEVAIGGSQGDVMACNCS